MEPLLLVLVLILVWAVILYWFNGYVVLAQPTKNLINLVLVLVAAITLLWAAGVVHLPVR